MTNQLSKPETVEMLARVICWSRVGDPDATDINKGARWKWWVEDAERYLRLFPNTIPAQSKLPLDAVAYLTQEDVTKLHGAAHSGAMLGGEAAYDGCLKVEGILAELVLRSVPTPRSPVPPHDSAVPQKVESRTWPESKQ